VSFLVSGAASSRSASEIGLHRVTGARLLAIHSAGLSLSPSLSLSLPPSLSFSLSLSLSLPLFLPLSLSRSLPLPLYLALTLSLAPSLPLSLSFSLPLSLGCMCAAGWMYAPGWAGCTCAGGWLYIHGRIGYICAGGSIACARAGWLYWLYWFYMRGRVDCGMCNFRKISPTHTHSLSLSFIVLSPSYGNLIGISTSSALF
jgi:hypothetical protein